MARNQPSKNGYYYKPDPGDLKEIDAYAYDEFGDRGWKARHAEAVITSKSPEGHFNKVTLIHLVLVDGTWYTLRSDELGGGGLLDTAGIKTGTMVKAATLLTEVIMLTPVKPKAKS